MNRRLLFIAAACSAAIAILHLAIIFAGAPAYRYFGAGEELAQLDEKGSFIPAAITFFIAVVFAVFSAYALSAAGAIRRLPFLKTALVAIGAIYTLRGLLLFVQVSELLAHDRSLLDRNLVFSAASLITGLLYVAATFLAWRTIGASRRAPSR